MSLSICYDVTMQSSILVFSFFLGVLMIFSAAFFKGMSSGNEAIPFSCDKEVEFVENMKIKKEEKALVLDKKSVCPNVNISDEKLETDEEENYDFWWDTIKLDLSFEQKMEMNHQMIDSGVFDMDFQKAAVEAPSMTLERKGSDVTILCFEENIHIASKAADVIFERHQLECDLIKFSKMDSQGMELILQSLQKTKHLVVIEDEWSNTGNEVFMAIRDCEGYSFYCERKTGYGRIIKVKE
ncbi:Oidioi.mRNA.OKI2018_I69.chr2.g4678.t1.cds [Oikopleura dioica]|uniref:Oidioi.mRNA.OKI2018_I69.chr2.g4678.t1.cds n=1 Tax=Oikopleura dioica TaxID=34765 RepID=A0ABN7T2D5_OIKDI|nr:Oidioi.mRNA.OKI2018_I69.chr2.g4678.t1.cds [Oikopleura dioica]